MGLVIRAIVPLATLYNLGENRAGSYINSGWMALAPPVFMCQFARCKEEAGTQVFAVTRCSCSAPMHNRNSCYFRNVAAKNYPPPQCCVGVNPLVERMFGCEES